MTAASIAFADEFLDAVVDVARVGICIVNANGVLVRAQDFNDSYLAGSSCHPSDTLPALLAPVSSR